MSTLRFDLNNDHIRPRMKRWGDVYAMDIVPLLREHGLTAEVSSLDSDAEAGAAT